MSAYRDQLRPCPGCHTPMEAMPIGGPRAAGEASEVDVCNKCRGVFIEFFDGEPGAISRGMVAQRKVRAAGAPTKAPRVKLTCPDCAAPMVRKAYLGKGPKIPRCGQCMSAFLMPDDIEALAKLEHEMEPERMPGPTWGARLLGWLGQSFTPAGKAEKPPSRSRRSTKKPLS